MRSRRSSSSRENSGCSCTLTCTYRLPGGPPLAPGVALPGDANLHPVVDAGGYGHGARPLPPSRSLARDSCGNGFQCSGRSRCTPRTATCHRELAEHAPLGAAAPGPTRCTYCMWRPGVPGSLPAAGAEVARLNTLDFNDRARSRTPLPRRRDSPVARCPLRPSAWLAVRLPRHRRRYRICPRIRRTDRSHQRGGPRCR